MMIRSNSCDKDEGVDVTDEEAVRKAIKRVKSDGGVSILSQSGHGDCLQSFHNQLTSSIHLIKILRRFLST